MAITTKVLKKRGRKLVRAGAASLQSGAETSARAVRSGATRARLAAGAAGALAVMGAGLAARKVRKVIVRRKVRKAMAGAREVATMAGKAALAAGVVAAVHTTAREVARRRAR
jgi:phosphate/sulfate permease